MLESSCLVPSDLVPLSGRSLAPRMAHHLLEGPGGPFALGKRQIVVVKGRVLGVS